MVSKRDCILQISKTMEETFKNKGEELAFLLDIQGNLLFNFPSIMIDDNLHSIMRGRHNSVRNLDPQVVWSLKGIVDAHDVVPILKIHIDQAYRELMGSIVCASYECAKRTLRWMLEAGVWACEFQTAEDRPTATELADEVIWKVYHEMTNTNIETEQRSTYAAFREALRIKEKFRLPAIERILDNIIVLKEEEVKGKVKELYGRLSKYAHFTPNTTYL